MRNLSLHDTLEAFATDAAGCLAEETAGGAEIPFELTETETRPGRSPLYCYRPLTGAFIRERLGLLSRCPRTRRPPRALAALDGVDAYLQQRGERRIPDQPRERADAALRSFLARVFAERSEFGFDAERFEPAYEELERALYEGRCVTTVIAPLLGVSLDPETRELPLGDGLSLVRGETLRGCSLRSGVGGARSRQRRRRGAERPGRAERGPGASRRRRRCRWPARAFEGS